jgi:hypothetical protein
LIAAPQKGCCHTRCGIEGGSRANLPAAIAASAASFDHPLSAVAGIAAEQRLALNGCESRGIDSHFLPRKTLIPLYLKNLTFIC